MDFLKDREFQLLAVKGFVLEIVWSVFPGIFVIVQSVFEAVADSSWRRPVFVTVQIPTGLLAVCNSSDTP